MPIYEYKCNQCAEVFESLQLRPTNKAQPCPKCGSGNTEKLLSVTASIISSGSARSNCGDMPDMPGGCCLNSQAGGGGCPGSGFGGACPMGPMGPMAGI